MVWRADASLTFTAARLLKTTTPAFPRYSRVSVCYHPEIATRLEYQWTNNIGDANTIGTRPVNGLLSVVFPTVSRPAKKLLR